MTVSHIIDKHGWRGKRDAAPSSLLGWARRELLANALASKVVASARSMASCPGPYIRCGRAAEKQEAAVNITPTPSQRGRWPKVP